MSGTSQDTIELDATQVAAFVDQVRHHLRDLSSDEQQDLTEGLEADLTELVAERGTDALGDPAAYAGELRAAAGLDQRVRRARWRRPAGEAVTALLDGAHAQWGRQLARLPHDPTDFLTVLRPVWWVFRAWLAAELLALWSAGTPTPIPSVVGSPEIGLAVSVVAAVVSVQIGRGRLWPGMVRTTLQRVVLLTLNVFALVVTPFVLGQFPASGTYDVGSYDYAPQGLTLNGNDVSNIYPYDSQGRPLVGVQLVDQDGHRLSAKRPYDAVTETEPWANGRTKVYSAFPLPSRTLDEYTGEPSGPFGIRPPLASLPPVSLQGVIASTLVTPSASASPSAGPSTGPSAKPAG